MKNEKIYLASDNLARVHPIVMKAIIEANEGYALPYGGDEWTHEIERVFQGVFGRKSHVLITTSGTATNVLALKLACDRHESIICTDIAHIMYQESGAVESIVGCKLLTIPHEVGKLYPEGVLKKLKSERAFGKHSTSPRVLSITQPTEVGTIYTLEEMSALRKLCNEENLLLHMDGSRLYNAAVALNASLSELTQFVDILSLGGTKNGLMCAEALLIFNPDLEKGCDHLHKQTLQLVSKMRYLSVQHLAFFKNDLWKTLALDANQRAQEIALVIGSIPELCLSYPVETNQIFFTAPPTWIPHIQEKIVSYVWNHDKGELRLIASWSTSEKEVTFIRKVLDQIRKEVSLCRKGD